MMSLAEWRELCLLISLDLPEKQIQLAFNYAMMTQVEEIKSEKCFQMVYPEFIEALARISVFFANDPALPARLKSFIQKAKRVLENQTAEETGEQSEEDGGTSSESSDEEDAGENASNPNLNCWKEINY